MRPRYVESMSSKLIREIVDSYELKKLDFGLNENEAVTLKGYKAELASRAQKRESSILVEREKVRKSEELKMKI